MEVWVFQGTSGNYMYSQIFFLAEGRWAADGGRLGYYI